MAEGVCMAMLYADAVEYTSRLPCGKRRRDDAAKPQLTTSLDRSACGVFGTMSLHGVRPRKKRRATIGLLLLSAEKERVFFPILSTRLTNTYAIDYACCVVWIPTGGQASTHTEPHSAVSLITLVRQDRGSFCVF